MRTLLQALLVSLLLPFAAHADTISFASIVGTTTYTYVSGQGSANGTGGSAVAYQNIAYASPIAGSQWLSTNLLGGNGATGITAYTDSFTLLANETYTGTLTFMADDQAGILINGVQVYAINSATGFNSPTTISLLSSYFKTGVNTITLQDSNSGGGPAAADFAGSVTGVATTPEPSSLLLLGSGVLVAFLLLRARSRVA